LAIFSVIYLLFLSGKLIYILPIWLILLSASLLYKYIVYKGVRKNFLEVAKKTGGKVSMGNYFFSVPPNIQFSLSDRVCHIGYIVDYKFDYVLEYVCRLDKELEIGFSHKEQGTANQIDDFCVTGRDRNISDTIFNNPKISKLIKELMRNFNFLIIGKDSKMRALYYPYDKQLTEPKQVFSNFDKMIKLADFLEKNIK
jgi:hypothetical protein